MEKKKLKLSISGASKKTINSIEQAKSQSKNTVVIEKRSPRFGGKPNFSRGAKSVESKSQSAFSKKEADDLIMSARDIVYQDWEMENGKEKIKVINIWSVQEDNQ